MSKVVIISKREGLWTKSVCDHVDSIEDNDEGMTLKCGDHELFLSWEVIDLIADVSTPHYFGEAIKENIAMNDKKKIN